MEVTIEKKARKKPIKVPDYLIYEVSKGKPIYYKGYKDVLNKTKTFEEIKMDSTLQAWLKFRISLILGNFLLTNGYEATAGEQGFTLSKTDKRGADFAIFKADNIVIDEHYSKIPPFVTIEIDVSADLENISILDYVTEKVADYHAFGVQKVIWIFTKNKKVMVAEAGQPWLTLDWSVDVEVVDGLVINLADIVAKKKM
jgi:Putative restriction endonuclease